MTSENTTTTVPDWLKQFADSAAACLSAGIPIAPVGCHCALEAVSSVWEVTLFIGRTEIRGGEHDGHCLPSFLTVDVNAVSQLFDVPPQVHLQAIEFAEKADPGTWLSFLGLCSGHRVWLRIPQQAPDWSGAGRTVDGATGQVRDQW
ncbi:MAG: hypothetical protein ACKO2P_01245 [Planctomycetota bacterium]